MRKMLVLCASMCACVAFCDEEELDDVEVGVAPITINLADSKVAEGQRQLVKLRKLTGTDMAGAIGKKLNADALREWVEVYERGDAKGVSVASAPLPSGVRMIAELRSFEYAQANLRFYADLGYNSVLVTVNSEDDEPQKLVELAQLVLAAGMSPWLAWAGPEESQAGVYRSLSRAREQFAAVLPMCVGFIPAWRRTSVHQLSQDEVYAQTLCGLALEMNPKLCIVDELYRNEHGLVKQNSVAGAGGTYVSGIGFTQMRPDVTLRKLFGEEVDYGRCLGLVVGAGGYYASRHDKKLTWGDALAAKIAVEKAFRTGGCDGTITLHGDASDKGVSIQTTDDIGLFPIGQ